ncbi:hypothetical protein AAC387_Pa02g1861 [Persea americana]
MELDQGIGADIARIKASLEVYRAKRKEQLVYMTQVKAHVFCHYPGDVAITSMLRVLKCSMFLLLFLDH